MRDLPGPDAGHRLQLHRPRQLRLLQRAPLPSCNPGLHGPIWRALHAETADPVFVAAAHLLISIWAGPPGRATLSLVALRRSGALQRPFACSDNNKWRRSKGHVGCLVAITCFIVVVATRLPIREGPEVRQGRHRRPVGRHLQEPQDGRHVHSLG